MTPRPGYALEWRRMKHLSAFLFFLAAASAPGLDVYVIRHAETMGNVTLDYSEANQNTFSPKGLEQVAGVAEKLKDLRFDAVLVSPLWRTRQTILPYLQAHQLTAEIWPEVEECCCDCAGDATPAREVPAGEKIVIPDDEAAYFTMRDGCAAVRCAPTNEAGGLAQLQRAATLIRSRFGGTSQSVLVVTHSCTGSRIIENLLGLKPAGRFSPGNVALSHLREGPAGEFELLVFNDQPFVPQFSWTLAGPEPPSPGAPLKFTLVPKYGAAGTNAYSLKWRLLNARNGVAHVGAERFAMRRGAKQVLEVPTDAPGAAPGEVWTLESSVYSAVAQVQRMDFRFLFPSYLSLEGGWRIRSGDDTNWAAVAWEDGDWATTSVPGGWEKDALPGYDGTAWYRLRFSVPPETQGGWGDAPLAVLLRAIDDADETFLNGQRIGASGEFPPAKVTAWDQARVYAFDATLLAETNVLAVRVSDWGGGGGIWRGPVAVGPAAELRTAVELAP